MTLRLAAELMHREGGKLGSPAERRHFLQAFAEAEVQGVLYQRILDHIDATEARQLAIPGLVLRRITPELVQHVLAGPTGLGSIPRQEARRLYQILGTESSLLIEQNGVLVHREDVRAQVLPIIQRTDPALVAAVHRRAVALYAARQGTENRTEELYHRLALGEDRRILERRWSDEAGTPLVSVLDEDLDPRVHAWLATKLNQGVSDEILRKADDPEWVVQVAKTARDLLDAGKPTAALRALERRSLEPLDLPTAALHVEALARTGRSRQAQELVAQAMDVAAEHGDGTALVQFSTIAAQLAEDSGDYSHALQLLTDARSDAKQAGDVITETALGASMLRLLRRQGLATEDDALELLEEVIRLARTLTRKQRTSSPGLVRDLAAEIGKQAPEFVIEASKMVGLDVTSQQALDNLMAQRKGDVADRIREILDTSPPTDTRSEGEDDETEHTSSSQGVAVGDYLEISGDVEVNGAVSEYFQVEADAPAFEEG